MMLVFHCCYYYFTYNCVLLVSAVPRKISTQPSPAPPRKQAVDMTDSPLPPPPPASSKPSVTIHNAPGITDEDDLPAPPQSAVKPMPSRPPVLPLPPSLNRSNTPLPPPPPPQSSKPSMLNVQDSRVRRTSDCGLPTPPPNEVTRQRRPSVESLPSVHDKSLSPPPLPAKAQPPAPPRSTSTTVGPGTRSLGQPPAVPPPRPPVDPPPAVPLPRPPMGQPPALPPPRQPESAAGSHAFCGDVAVNCISSGILYFDLYVVCFSDILINSNFGLAARNIITMLAVKRPLYDLIWFQCI